MIDQNLVEDLKAKNLGKWVAVKGSVVLAISDTDTDIEVFKALKERGIEGAFVFRSPTEAERRRGFLLRIWKMFHLQPGYRKYRKCAARRLTCYTEPCII